MGRLLEGGLTDGTGRGPTEIGKRRERCVGELDRWGCLSGRRYGCSGRCVVARSIALRVVAGLQGEKWD